MNIKENQLKMISNLDKSPIQSKKVKINEQPSEYEGTLRTSSKGSEQVGSPNSIKINESSLKKQSLETDNS